MNYHSFGPWTGGTTTLARLSEFIVKKVHDELEASVRKMEEK